MSTEETKSSDKKPLAAIPIVLTILATIFAGLSSSEMTRSMYYRSLAGQYQAKAASQWGFFQAKKMRGTTLETANDLAMLFYVKPFEEGVAVGMREILKQSEPALSKNENLLAATKALRETLESTEVQTALRYLSGTELPTSDAKPIENSALNELLIAVRSRTPESKTGEIVAKISAHDADAAVETALSNADAFDRAAEPAVSAIRKLERSIDTVDQLVAGIADQPNELKALAGAVHGAALSLRFANQDFTARRYDREAKFNQQIGELYEVQVRRAGFDSERHRVRSKNFFYAMLCAQAGVTIASLALAKSRQSAFWFAAGLAGLIAIAFGAYVYLAM